MDYLIRFAHLHQSFQIPELTALATLHRIDLHIVFYDPTSPFCVVRLPSEDVAKALIHRSILIQGIFELWATADDHVSLRSAVASNTFIDLAPYQTASFRFSVDSFQGKRNSAQQRELIEAFDFLGFSGPITMENAEFEFCIFEDYELRAPLPKKVYFGRWLAKGGRDAIFKYDLKKRSYISRTSMNAELSLVTANLVLSEAGKLVYDPFVGTGSFLVACAHFGSSTIGSDIDGRSIRGTVAKNQLSNFEQYELTDYFIDSFISDITHTPLRLARILDAIVCDPPYGVREGPKVLGARVEGKSEIVMIDGVPAYMRPGYIPPKRPYGFDDMMHDIMNHSAMILVDHGRLGMWMPTADDEDIELAIPKHPALRLLDICIQSFNKWSRRLLIYERLPDSLVEGTWPSKRQKPEAGLRADDLNQFRKKYFQGFKGHEPEP